MTHLLASRTATGDILILNEHKAKKGKNFIAPYLILKGHEGEGYAIEWNHNNATQLVGGSYDGKLSVWDTLHKTTNNCIEPMSNFIFHQSEIEDVSYSHYHDSIFASCDDGGYTAFWDIRSSHKPIFSMKRH